MKSNKTSVFTIMGIVLASIAAIAGIAYVIYRFFGCRCLADDCCYEYGYDCDDCDCDECDDDCDCGDDAEEETSDAE